MVTFLAGAPYASIAMAWKSASALSRTSGGSGWCRALCCPQPAPLAPDAPQHFGFQFGAGMPHPWKCSRPGWTRL